MGPVFSEITLTLRSRVHPEDSLQVASVLNASQTSDNILGGNRLHAALSKILKANSKNAADHMRNKIARCVWSPDGIAVAMQQRGCLGSPPPIVVLSSQHADSHERPVDLGPTIDNYTWSPFHGIPASRGAVPDVLASGPRRLSDQQVPPWEAAQYPLCFWFLVRCRRSRQ